MEMTIRLVGQRFVAHMPSIDIDDERVEYCRVEPTEAVIMAVAGKELPE